jgi:hypothetical protein
LQLLEGQTEESDISGFDNSSSMPDDLTVLLNFGLSESEVYQFNQLIDHVTARHQDVNETEFMKVLNAEETVTQQLSIQTLVSQVNLFSDDFRILDEAGDLLRTDEIKELLFKAK